MTLDEMDGIAKKANAIRSALEVLQKVEFDLRLFNECRKSGKWPDSYQWHPTLTIKKGGSYGRDIDIRISLPVDVVQQQLIYAVMAARRHVIMAGGSLP